MVIRQPAAAARDPPVSDPLTDPLAAFCRAHGLMLDQRGRTCFLRSARTGAPVARLRATGETNKVEVQWWTGERWRAPGPFGTPTMALERALNYVASEPAFWIYA
jgi:hypothetical protein